MTKSGNGWCLSAGTDDPSQANLLNPKQLVSASQRCPREEETDL
jgi:hypothetical protein